MQRIGAIQVRKHPQWSSWRDIMFPLREPISMETHLLFEDQAREIITAFECMPLSPLGRFVTLVLGRARDDTDAISDEIDRCITAVNHRLGLLRLS